MTPSIVRRSFTRTTPAQAAVHFGLLFAGSSVTLRYPTRTVDEVQALGTSHAAQVRRVDDGVAAMADNGILDLLQPKLLSVYAVLARPKPQLRVRSESEASYP